MVVDGYSYDRYLSLVFLALVSSFLTPLSLHLRLACSGFLSFIYFSVSKVYIRPITLIQHSHMTYTYIQHNQTSFLFLSSFRIKADLNVLKICFKETD